LTYLSSLHSGLIPAPLGREGTELAGARAHATLRLGKKRRDRFMIPRLRAAPAGGRPAGGITRLQLKFFAIRLTRCLPRRGTSPSLGPDSANLDSRGTRTEQPVWR
jgi:hypothetical protein